MSTMTRSRTRADAAALSLLAALLLGSAGAGAAPPAARSPSPPSSAPSPSRMEAEHRAAYPLGAPAAGPPLAGVRLSRLTLPGLQLSARSDAAADEGGIVLSFADAAGTVRAVVRLAVTTDADAARRLLDESIGQPRQCARGDEQQQHQRSVAQRPGKAALIALEPQRESPLGPALEPARRPVPMPSTRRSRSSCRVATHAPRKTRRLMASADRKSVV